MIVTEYMENGSLDMFLRVRAFTFILDITWKSWDAVYLQTWRKRFIRFPAPLNDLHQQSQIFIDFDERRAVKSDVLSLSEEWRPLHCYSAGGGAERSRVRYEIFIRHELRSSGPGGSEHSGEQQPGVQGLRLRDVQSAWRWTRRSLHHQSVFTFLYIHWFITAVLTFATTDTLVSVTLLLCDCINSLSGSWHETHPRTFSS